MECHTQKITTLPWHHGMPHSRSQHSSDTMECHTQKITTLLWNHVVQHSKDHNPPLIPWSATLKRSQPSSDTMECHTQKITTFLWHHGVPHSKDHNLLWHHGVPHSKGHNPPLTPWSATLKRSQPSSDTMECHTQKITTLLWHQEEE